MWEAWDKFWAMLAQSFNVVSVNIDTIDQASTYANKRVRAGIRKADIMDDQEIAKLEAVA